jgi:hypothetical protein
MKTKLELGVIGLVLVAGALGALLMTGGTGCETTVSTVATTNAANGTVTDTSVTNQTVNPLVITVAAGVLQGATTLGASYVIQHDTNDIVYLDGVRAALTLALTGTNVPPSDLTPLLANVQVANPQVSSYAQSQLSSLAAQYSAAYGQLVAQGLDANSVAGPLLTGVLNGLNAALGK